MLQILFFINFSLEKVRAPLTLISNTKSNTFNFIKIHIFFNLLQINKYLKFVYLYRNFHCKSKGNEKISFFEIHMRDLVYFFSKLSRTSEKS